MTQDDIKRLVAYKAIARLSDRGYIHSGVKIGMGTGSTASLALEALVKQVAALGIEDVRIVPTSYDTSLHMDSLGVRLYAMNDSAIGGSLDWTIDGADEVATDGTLIKGGGAALLQEKILAYNSKCYIIVVDETKLVDKVGSGFPVPIEIVSCALLSVQKVLKGLGATSLLRMGVHKCGPLITDNGNWILDALWKTGMDKSLGASGTGAMDATPAMDASTMEAYIKGIAGVVEVGLFTKVEPRVFIGYKQGTVELRGKL